MGADEPIRVSPSRMLGRPGLTIVEGQWGQTQAHTHTHVRMRTHTETHTQRYTRTHTHTYTTCMLTTHDIRSCADTHSNKRGRSVVNPHVWC